VIDISAIMTGHREKLLAGPALASFEEAVLDARNHGLCVETILVLDRPDAATQAIFERFAARGHRLVLNDEGDPGLTRNRGVREAKGDFVGFLDADDLWSFNWLTAAHEFCAQCPDTVIAHSELNLAFGDEQVVWFHADAAATNVPHEYQRLANYWDAMSFGLRSLYLEHPFVENALKDGYGHEDWHWNNLTLEAGLIHRPVPGTVHFKRRRPGTQMSRCDENDVVVRPSALTRFDWKPTSTLV
jgi:glycosyltransferase involved in cell wall biosynthesis